MTLVLYRHMTLYKYKVLHKNRYYRTYLSGPIFLYLKFKFLCKMFACNQVQNSLNISMFSKLSLCTAYLQRSSSSNMAVGLSYYSTKFKNTFKKFWIWFFLKHHERKQFNNKEKVANKVFFYKYPFETFI